MFSYHRPASTEEALSILSREACVPLAGGTDFYPARVGKPIQENVMDLTGIRSLRGIEERAEGIWMGALTTWLPERLGDSRPRTPAPYAGTSAMPLLPPTVCPT